MASYKSEVRTRTVSAAVDDFYGEMEELAGECQDGFDNATEGQQNGERGQALQETISVLEELSSPEFPDNVPEELRKKEVNFSVQVYGGKYAGQEARHVRASNACAGLFAALDELERDTISDEVDEWIEGLREDLEKVEVLDAWTMRG